MTYPVKIEFKEYPSGSWQDWSEFLSEAPTINRRVESENEGEAGIIVFDNANVSFRYDADTPVYNAFNQNLSEKQRYLFRISAPKSDKTYVPLFEGMDDFSTIAWTDDQPIISFEIADKLSALGILPSTTGRIAVDYYDLIGEEWQSWYMFQFGPGDVPDKCLITYQELAGGTMQYADIPVNHPFEIGRLIKHPDDFEDGLNNTDSRFFLITEITADTANGHTARLLTILANGAPVNNSATYTSLPVYSELFYGTDINIINAGVLQAYDGLKIIEGIINQQWPSITTINLSGDTTFLIPLEYFSRTIDENPLGSDSLQALKTLSDSMKCYVFINRAGNLVIQNKEDLATNGITRSIGDTKKISGSRKYFWDKLVDGVTVKAKSWVLDEGGEYLEGESTITKTLAGTSAPVKPKNSITKELLVDNSSKNTQELLDIYAAEQANWYLGFYGLRRSVHELELKLDDNTIEWELIDNIGIDSVSFFFTSLEIDLVEKTIILNPVETNGHDYDFRQVVVSLSESNSTAVSSGSSSSGAGLTILNNERGIVYVG